MFLLTYEQATPASDRDAVSKPSANGRYQVSHAQGIRQLIQLLYYAWYRAYQHYARYRALRGAFAVNDASQGKVPYLIPDDEMLRQDEHHQATLHLIGLAGSRATRRPRAGCGSPPPA